MPLTGRLLTKDGRALAGSQIYVFSRGADGAERYAGTATTDAAGRYRYMVRASANQTLKLFYLGAPSVRPAIKVVDLEVPARTGFSVSDRRLLNGQSVTFSGRLAVRAHRYRRREAGGAPDQAQRPVADVPNPSHRCAAAVGAPPTGSVARGA